MQTADRKIIPEFHRSIFLSDLHLGSHGCREEAILSFLERHDAEVIYLVGDVFDIWDPLIVHWTERHDRIVDLLRSRAADGREIVYLVGNHDRVMIEPDPAMLPGSVRLPVTVQTQAVHQAADGLRYLVLHGDVCDARILRFHICTRIGSRIDSFLRLLDRALRGLRLQFRKEARGPFELAMRGLNAMLYRSHRHERALVALAEAAGCDGVICGHFHLAALHDDFGIRYVNCGDWTDNCTAVVEAWDGTLRLCAQEMAQNPAATPAVDQAAPPSAVGVG